MYLYTTSIANTWRRRCREVNPSEMYVYEVPPPEQQGIGESAWYISREFRNLGRTPIISPTRQVTVHRRKTDHTTLNAC